MRFLVAGLGSIGQRHARNLRALVSDIELVALRRRNSAGMVGEAGRFDPHADPAVALGMTVVHSVDEALATRPDAVVVCTPSSAHLEVATAAASLGCHLYIEKPVAHTLAGVDALLAETIARSLVTMVGCQWRFHPCLRELHRLLGMGIVGEVQRSTIEYAEYLPDWHPWEDYRQSYAARADLGGGVVLSHIHDLDLAWWLFGPPSHITATGGRESELEIDVEDTARATLTYPGLMVQVNQTFASSSLRRSIDVTGSQGNAHVDLVAGTLLIEGDVARSARFPDFQRNDMYLDAMREFVRCVRTGSPTSIPLSEGIEVLRIATAVKAAMAGSVA